MQPANGDSADRMRHSITTFCVCGCTFQPDSEDDSYCSIQCARIDTLKALSRGESGRKRANSPIAIPADLHPPHAVNSPAIERRHGDVPEDGCGTSETGLSPTNTLSMSEISPNTATSTPNRPRLRRMRSSRELARLAKSHGNALPPFSSSQSLPSDPIGPPVLSDDRTNVARDYDDACVVQMALRARLPHGPAASHATQPRRLSGPNPGDLADSRSPLA